MAAATVNRTIAVIGAGIGGLAFATLAARAGHDVTLLERFEAPRPIGSGLVVQPVGLAVLDRLGAGRAARDLGRAVRGMRGHEALSGRDVLGVRYAPDRPGLALHRASLFQPLWDLAMASGLRLVTGATVAAAPVANPVASPVASPVRKGLAREVLLEDGRRFGPFDLVVDASGAGSRLSPMRARPLRYGALWGTVPWPAASGFDGHELRQCYRRADRMIGILPVGRLPGGGGDLATVFWSLPTAEFADWRTRPLSDWRGAARALWPASAPFVDQITDHDQLTMARFSHGTLRRPYAPGLAFIGDAAHRTSPQLGQGANMALLDALALADALGLPVDQALALYALRRRWHVRSYQMMSRLFTPLYQSDSRVLPVLRDHLLAPLASLPPLSRRLTRMVGGELTVPLNGTAFPARG